MTIGIVTPNSVIHVCSRSLTKEQMKIESLHKAPGILAVIVVGGMTVMSSVAGVGKVAQSFTQPSGQVKEVPEVRTVQAATVAEVEGAPTAPNSMKVEKSSNNSAVTSAKKNPQSTPSPSASPNPTVSPQSTPAGKTLATPKPVTVTATSATNNANKCIITLSGALYDVTSLQNSHSGGNIFTCGTDMTAVYMSEHGGNLSRMARYKIVDGSSTVPSSFSSSGGNQGSGSNSTVGDREKDEDYEDHYEDEDEDDKNENEREEEQETERES